MRVPIRHLAGPIVWTPQGGAWAVWRVEGPGLALISGEARRRYLAVIEGMIKQLRGEAMLLSLCPLLDPAAVAERMIRDVDLDASPRYVQVVDRVLDQLEHLELSGRTDWLAMPLPASRWQTLRDATAAARHEVALRLGLLPAPVSAAEEQRCLDAAAELQTGWPPEFRVRPAYEAEILWMFGHALRRGVAEQLLPGEPARRRGRGRGAAALGDAVLYEGGLPGGAEEMPVRRAAARASAPRRRWLQVATEYGTSYQVLLALGEMPAQFAFPGSEYLQSLDAYDFPIDWAVRLNVLSREKARRKTDRQANELAHQHTEHQDAPSGPPGELAGAEEELRAYRERLAASQTEVEVQAMVAMCVWGTTPQEAEERAKALKVQFATAEYQLTQPAGEQEALWYGMLPGTRTPKVMAAYRQYLTARDFAMAGAATGGELGDATGPLLGLQTTSGGVRPVLTNWAGATARRQSASAAFVGELGSGKTVGLKTAVHGVLTSGRRVGVPGSRGRAVIVDRTSRREWVAFAEACPGDTQVIEIDASARISLDPLRIFAEKETAQRRTESFLSLLLGIAGSSEEGTVLSEAAAAVLAEPRPSMPKLLARLQAMGAADAAARAVARRLAAVERKDLAHRLLFDATLPAVELSDADSVVFAVSELELPTAEELAHGGVERLEFEKLLGRSVMYLVAALCRQMCFASRREFCVAVWDECWWLTSSPEGMRLLLELVRDGRKHHAGVFVGSHDPEDIGPSNSTLGHVVLGLIPRRFVFRHTARDLAERGLRFLGVEPTAELVRVVTAELSPTNLPAAEAELRAGECLHRDLAGRIGAAKVLMPLDDLVLPHMFSDPETAQAQVQMESAA